MEKIIEVREMAKTFKNETALSQVTFDVTKGEIFGFLGPSGAGKTTTIKILTGQLDYTNGYVRVFGEDTDKLRHPEARKKFGVLTDNSGLYERLSIADNLLFYCQLYQVDTKKVDEILDIVQLRADKAKRVSKLSKGMRQRVILARALLHEPSLLFLDEPTSALDPVSTKYIHAGLRALNEKGTTIFLTTHDMYEADELCDRIAFLHEGEIKIIDTPKNLKQHFATDEVQIELKTGEQITLSKGPQDAKQLFTYMQNEQIATIHSNEPTISDIFVQITGRELQ